MVSSNRYKRLARCSGPHTYFWSSLRILITVFLETKTELWTLMWAISGYCIGSSPLHPPASVPVIVCNFNKNGTLSQVYTLHSCVTMFLVMIFKNPFRKYSAILGFEKAIVPLHTLMAPLHLKVHFQTFATSLRRITEHHKIYQWICTEDHVLSLKKIYRASQFVIFNPWKVPNSLATLLKKRLWHKCFPVNFTKFLRPPFLKNTSGWLLLEFILTMVDYTLFL